MACIVYIAIIGRIGWQIFKYNAPFFKRRGGWYLIWQKDKRFKLIYEKFKTVWKWKDGTTTTIRRNFERIAQTAEPLIFLVEGYATNANLGEVLPKEEQSYHINNIIKLAQANERLKAQEQYHIETKGWMRHLPLITALLAVVTLAIAIGIFMSMNDIKGFITWVQPKINEYLAAQAAKVPVKVL